jgi:sigma-E factor negative regulatory protein RseA
VAGLASVVLAGVLGWQGLQWTNEGNTTVTPQLAQSPLTPSASPVSSDVLAIAKTFNERQTLLRPDGTSALVAASEPLVMIRNPQLDALLAAHRQLGGVSALQMPAGFLRNTTFEEGPR